MIVKYYLTPLSREATPILKKLLNCRRGGLIRRRPAFVCTEILKYYQIIPLKRCHRLVGSLFHCRMGGLTKGVLLF
jgi:hypothetical protein